MNDDLPMSDDELRDYLSRAESGGELPAGFRDQLWNELRAELGDEADPPAAPVIAIEADTGAEAREPTPNIWSPPATDGESRLPWLAAAAAVLLVVAGVAFLALNSDSADIDVATDEDQAVPSSTSEPPSSTSSEAPTTTIAPEDLDFEAALGIVSIDETAVAITFMPNQATAFNATVRDGAVVVQTEGGSADGAEPIQLDFDRLDPATTYTVEVTLIGPPSVLSERLEFRTAADPSDPASFDVPITIDSAELMNDDGRIEVSTNLCSAVSFVLLDPADQREIGRSSTNEANADSVACETTHVLDTAAASAEVGYSGPYTVIIEVEEVVDGVGSGNVAVTTISVPA